MAAPLSSYSLTPFFSSKTRSIPKPNLLFPPFPSISSFRPPLINPTKFRTLYLPLISTHLLSMMGSVPFPLHLRNLSLPISYMR